MKVDIEDRRLLTIDVDTDGMVAAFPDMWKSFLADYESDGYESRRDYLNDWIHEVGLEDFLGHEWVTITADDGELDVDVKK